MKIDLSVLMSAASDAKPSPELLGRERDRWARLFPVYQQLRENGFRCDAAMRWLVDHGAIGVDDIDRAQNAFWQLSVRRKKQRQLQERKV